MLYYLFEYLESEYQFPGATLFQFITFRAAMAIILSLLISTIYGKRIIEFLRKKQMGRGEVPTMGEISELFSSFGPQAGL